MKPNPTFVVPVRVLDLDVTYHPNPKLAALAWMAWLTRSNIRYRAEFSGEKIEVRPDGCVGRQFRKE